MGSQVDAFDSITFSVVDLPILISASQLFSVDTNTMGYLLSTFLNYPPSFNQCLQKTIPEKSEAALRTLLPKAIIVKGASAPVVEREQLSNASGSKASQPNYAIMSQLSYLQTHGK